MNSKIMDFADLMREEESAQHAVTVKQMEREQAEWEALPQAERDRINAERERKWAEFEEAVERAEAEAGDEDEDEQA